MAQSAPEMWGHGVGQKVKDARTELGWSQEKLAREVEMSRESIRRIEGGGLTQMHTLDKLAGAMGKSLWELLPDKPFRATPRRGRGSRRKSRSAPQIAPLMVSVPTDS